MRINAYNAARSDIFFPSRFQCKLQIPQTPKQSNCVQCETFCLTQWKSGKHTTVVTEKKDVFWADNYFIHRRKLSMTRQLGDAYFAMRRHTSFNACQEYLAPQNDFTVQTMDAFMDKKELMNFCFAVKVVLHAWKKMFELQHSCSAEINKGLKQADSVRYIKSTVFLQTFRHKTFCVWFFSCV